MSSNNGQIIGNIFFFLVLSAFLFLAYLLFKPFLKVIVISILIAVIFYPLNTFFRKHLKSEFFAAFLATFVIFLFIIIPSIFLIVFLSNEFLALYPVIVKHVSQIEDIKIFLQNIPILSFLHEKFTTFLEGLNIKLEFDDILKNILNSILSFFVTQSKSIFLNITIFLFNLVMMLFTIFFLFLDGKSLYKRIYELIPFSKREKEFLILKTYRAIQGVVLGAVFTAVAQGILSFIGYVAVGIEFSLFWAFVTFIAAFFPIGGASLVWVPIAIYVFLMKGIVPGILFTLYGTLIISTVDNIIKPIVIGDKTNIHPMILVFAILGGLNFFGFLGVFLAPIIMVLLDNLLVLYRIRYISSDS
ncbi:MAG: AI-2E family transporter [Aquificae bacterium]|nr:AI-2E family transporter [Aquificota bacterium]